MWDLLHPSENLRGAKPNNPFKFRRPLPEIKRADDYGQVWQTAPYANDYQLDNFSYQPPVTKQITTDY